MQSVREGRTTEREIVWQNGGDAFAIYGYSALASLEKEEKKKQK